MDSAPGDPPAPSPIVPPIWVLSLARATERRRAIERNFGALGIPYELIEAVDGRAVDVSGYASQWRSRYEVGRPLSPGEIAASLTHLRAYQRIVDDDLPHAVVVEDDVEPTPALLDVLAAVDDLPADWELVTLHSLFASARPQPLPRPPLAGSHRLCTYERMPYGAQCVLVRRAAAERLVEVGFPIRFPPDDLLFRRSPAHLRYYGVEPSPVIHADFGSELGVTRTDDARGIARLGARVVVAAGKVRARLQRAVAR